MMSSVDATRFKAECKVVQYYNSMQLGGKPLNNKALLFCLINKTKSTEKSWIPQHYPTVKPRVINFKAKDEFLYIRGGPLRRGQFSTDAQLIVQKSARARCHQQQRKKGI